jgi:pilus assembly protein CpaB
MKKYITSVGRTGVFTVLALLLGALGVIAVRMNQPPPPPPAPPKVFDVLVASTPLQPGRTITKSDFYLQKMTWEQKKTAGFTESHFSAGKDLIGRIVRQPLTKGHYFTLDCLYPEGTGPSISEKLKPGMRAVVIPVEPASVTNLTTPDSYVDVLFYPSSTAAGNAKVGASLVGGRVLGKIQLLAVNQDWYAQSLPAAQHATPRGAAVTLAVTLQQAELLKSLESLGRFSLVAVTEAGQPTIPGEVPNPDRLKQILGWNDPPPALRPRVIEVIRGGTMTQVALNSPIATSIPWGTDPIDLFQPMGPGPVPISIDPHYMQQPPPVQSPPQFVPSPPSSPVPMPSNGPGPAPAISPVPSQFNVPVPPAPMSSRTTKVRPYATRLTLAGPVASAAKQAVPQNSVAQTAFRGTQRAKSPVRQEILTVTPRTTLANRSTSPRTPTASQQNRNISVVSTRQISLSPNSGGRGPSPARRGNHGIPIPPVPIQKTSQRSRSGPTPQRPVILAARLSPTAAPQVGRASSAFHMVRNR